MDQIYAYMLWLTPSMPKDIQEGWREDRKNSFHTFEHALICYMTTQQIKGKPITLYYAFKNKNDYKNYAHPYFFFGKFNKIEVKKSGFSELTAYSRYKVKFSDLR